MATKSEARSTLSACVGRCGVWCAVDGGQCEELGGRWAVCGVRVEKGAGRRFFQLVVESTTSTERESIFKSCREH